MKINFICFSKKVFVCLCFFLINSVVYSQCNTANFTVTKVNGTCFSNGSLTVNVPTSTDCSGWVAEIIKLPNGTPFQQSVPTNGGSIVFGSLQAGNYSVSLSNGFTTIPYTSNPVAITTTYVNMNVSTTGTAPSCRNSAPGYTPNGTLTINVANGTGLGPFLYSVTSTTGTQSFTTSNRSYTFSNMPGGEQVNISVTDLANNDLGCTVTVNQSPTTVSNSSSPLSFDVRPFNYERDCSNTTASCNNVNLFVNLSNVNAASLANLQLPGNAKITIAGVDYPLTYVSGAARFKYDPITTGGPQLVNGTVITTTFNGGCDIISKTSTVSMNDNFINLFTNTETVFSNCSVRYKFTILGDQDVSGGSGHTDRAIYFCTSNSLKFELRNPDGVTYTDVTASMTNASGGALPVNNPLGVNIGTSIPSAGVTVYSTQPGFYRITVSDACHSVVRTVNVVTTNPFGWPVQAIESTSVLEGTSSISLWFNSLPPLGSPLTAKVTRFDGQTSMTINPSQPLSKAGSYTINFPIIRTFNYPSGDYTFSDLPLGRYIVELTNSCSETTGLKGVYDITLTNPTSYNPVFSVTNSCTGSNIITYNMNSVNAKPSPYTVKLYNNNGSGGLGTLVATSTSNSLSGSFLNLNSGNYIINFENVTPLNYFTGYSAAFDSGTAQTYSKAITIEPYTDITVSTSTAICDISNSNSGIINAQISSGTIIYPMTFTLYNAANQTTPVQGPFTVNSPVDNYSFSGLALGNYVVKVTNSCYSVNSNVTISNSNTVPSAQVSNPTICPNSPTTIAIISATNNLYDITWTDNNNVVVGTGMPITLAPSVTTTYTATFALKSTFGCPNTTTYQSNVTVTVTPNPDLSLAVSDINLCDGSSPSITISNTQNNFSYEIVDVNGTSFSPQIIANGNGGSVTIAIPNTISLVAGQIFKVKATNGNAGCTGLLTDVSNVLNGTFNITCPTFPLTSVQCYDDLPSQTSYTITQFQGLGNGDGIVNVVGCGVLEITASNGSDPGCNANITRTFTITEYADPNNNDVRDAGENTILNTTNCTQTININDTTAPVVTGTLSAQNISGCSLTAAPAAMTTVAALESAGLTISDNCTSDLNLVVSSVDGTASGTCPITFTRTYTITDACNNSITATQTININDTTAPVVTGTLSAQNISGCSLTAAPAAMTTVAALESAGLTISDNCTSDLNLVVSSVDGTASGTCPITFTRTYTITDACNNSITATQTININDTTAPVVTGTLSAQNISGCSLTAAPSAMTTVAALESAGLTISDNCTSDLNLVVSSVDGTASGTCPITFTRTYTITDACNNSITATQTININDTTAPVVTGTLSAQNVSGCSLTDAPSAMTTVAALESAGLTISDNCLSDLNLVVSSVDGTASGTCPITFTRTYTITDACNNSITATQTININDTTAPVVTGTLSAQNISGCSLTAAPSAMTTVAALESAGLTISDNCTSDLNLVVSSVDGTASGTCPITFTRTYTITDACNNSITASQTININDTTAPVVTGTLSAQNISGCSLTDAPSAMTTVAALESAGLTISDNCTSDLNLVVSSVDGTASGTCPITFTRTYTITDACNNSITATQTININDTTAPVVTGTLSAQNVSGCSLTDAPSAMTTVAALESAGLTISDNCTSDLNLVVSSVDGTASGTCPITFTRTYTITDACNNSITATQTININDTTAPVVTGTLSAQNVSGCSLTDAPSAMTTVAALESAGLTISDNCTSDLNLVVSSVDGTASGTCPITFTRTYTITDACNNSITATQTININDTTAPVVTGTLSAQNISGCSLTDAPSAMTTVAALESAGLTISDNCTSDSNLVVSSVDGTASGTCPITFTRTYTITDACNNSITATQTININDTTAPVVTGTLSAQNISGCSLTAAPSAMTTVAALESAGLTISDNCTSDSNLVVSSVDGTASGTCPITFTRTYTITDACNNSITATQTINISDTTAPVVQTTIGSLNVSLECSNTSGLTAALALIPTATDNCTSPVLHLVSDITTVDSICSNAYVRVRTWNFTDACGNTSTSFVQTITVQDTTAPVFSGTLPQDVTLECNQTIPASVSLTATDSCGGNVTVSFSEQTVAGSCANNYTLFRTWTATDVCGNFTTHIQEINVQDTTPPVFVETLPAAEIYAKCDGIPVAPTLTATDNCGAVTVSYNEVRIDGDCTNKYRLERTWTAIDACGNETEFNQTVYLACYVTPYNALSPDGDGLNDIFIIEGLECYPNNSVEIFNRWGVKIFEASFYDNVNTVFRGMSDGRVTVSRNDKLPTGTYFYKLKYEYDLYGREKENIEKTGYIYIQNE